MNAFLFPLQLVLQKTEVPAAPIKPKEKPKSADPGSSSSSGTANPVVQPTAPPAQITLQPLFKSLKDAHYTYIRCLDIWGLELDDDAVVSLVSPALLYCGSQPAKLL